MKKKKDLSKSELKKLTAKEFDEYFDNGGDISPLMTAENTIFRVNVDFPLKTVDGLDREAARIGITRQALIKTWIADRLDAVQEKQKKPTKKSVS